MQAGTRIAVLIPCYNEERTVGDVVRSFARELPDAAIFVCDNNSQDRTADEARAAGARVFTEKRQGKGYVVQSMFRLIDADVYVMVDGDATYPASAVRSLIAPVIAGTADMVIGSRLHAESHSEFSMLNQFGNRMYRWLTNVLFGYRITDLLSGYRAFSRRLVRSLPLFGGGFETEAEITIKTLRRGYSIVEIPVNLVPRPKGSRTKIRIVRDGFVILNMILTLVRDYKPLTLFGIAGLLLLLGSLTALVIMVLGGSSLSTFALGVISAVLGLGGSLFVSVGLILHTITRHFQELDSELQMMAAEWRRDQIADD